MAKNTLRIDILGTAITISTDEERVYLDKLLSKYRGAVENVEKISGLDDPLKVAILTGFLLCDDLEKAATPKENKFEQGKAEQMTLGMISRLDEILCVAEEPDCLESS